MKGCFRKRGGADAYQKIVAVLPATCLLVIITIGYEYAVLFNVSVNKFRHNHICVSPVYVFDAASPMLNPYPIFVFLIVKFIFTMGATHKLAFVIFVIFKEWLDPK